MAFHQIDVSNVGVGGDPPEELSAGIAVASVTAEQNITGSGIAFVPTIPTEAEYFVYAWRDIWDREIPLPHIEINVTHRDGVSSTWFDEWVTPGGNPPSPVVGILADWHVYLGRYVFAAGSGGQVVFAGTSEEAPIELVFIERHWDTPR